MHDANAPPDRARLVLVRHCATPLNEARKYQGHEDVALSPAGREMARGMAAGFAERGSRCENCLISAVATRSSWIFWGLSILRPAASVTQKVSRASP